jgi:hypothetical protein
MSYGDVVLRVRPTVLELVVFKYYFLEASSGQIAFDRSYSSPRNSFIPQVRKELGPTLNKLGCWSS